MTQAREITPYLIRLYLDKMRGDHMSSGLVARDYGAFKCFFRFLTQERLIPHNPITLVEKPRMERKLIKPLSMDQLRLMQLLGSTPPIWRSVLVPGRPRARRASPRSGNS